MKKRDFVKASNIDVFTITTEGLDTDPCTGRPRVRTYCEIRSADLAALTAERDRYRAALERLSEGNLDSVNWVAGFARRALESPEASRP